MVGMCNTPRLKLPTKVCEKKPSVSEGDKFPTYRDKGHENRRKRVNPLKFSLGIGEESRTVTCSCPVPGTGEWRN